MAFLFGFFGRDFPPLGGNDLWSRCLCRLGVYSLSGYLMTHVLRHKYGDTVPGLRDFAYNRFLRICPMYAVALIAGAIALWLASRTGITATDLNPQFIWPQNNKTWFVNISLLPLPSWGLLVPVSGALAVEVGAYILIPLLAFSRPAAWIALILSLIVNANFGFGTDTFAVRYSSFMTCFWVFAAGSLVSHYKKELSVLVFPKLSMLTWLAHCLVWIWYDPWPWTYGLYFSVLLSSWVIVSIESVKSNRIDSIFGDLSYPIYLFHTVVGIFILMLGFKIRSFDFFVASFITTLTVSWLLVATVDRRINLMKLRKNLQDVPLSFGGDKAH